MRPNSERAGGPTITAVKTVSVSPLVVGGSGQFYNITITIANSATTAALTIADTLATGITLSGASTITGGTSTATLSGCPASGSNTTGCQINSRRHRWHHHRARSGERRCERDQR
ncbi:MAG: hypothetical protein IPN04_11620 [Rhodoferax sp.]|nr:hypothetical protein [Rhodoferax sp.]